MNIVVVSRSSLQSDWLSYELNLAADRVVKGDLRIIPVVIDSDEMPAELKGRLYADFRKSFEDEVALVERALAPTYWFTRAREYQIHRGDVKHPACACPQK